MSRPIRRFGYLVRATAFPNVWKLDDGRFLVRARTKGPDDKLREVRRVLDARTARDASQRLSQLLQEAKEAKEAETDAVVPPLFSEYAPMLLERKVATGELKSAATQSKWRYELGNLEPHFGHFRMSAITRQHVLVFRDGLARDVLRDALKPSTARSRLGVLRVVLRTWLDDSGQEHDPTRRIRGIESTYRTYTRERPNALQPAQVAPFLDAMQKLAPRYYPMALLALATGLRTCALRALRVCDVDYTAGAVIHRRSHTVGQIVMERTKTGRDLEVAVPQLVLDVLAEVAGDRPPEALLFPTRTGRLQFRNNFRIAVRRAAAAIGVELKPHGLRRTAVDLLRQAGASRAVAMATVGHASDRTHDHYSSVGSDEQRAAIERALQLGGVLGGVP